MAKRLETGSSRTRVEHAAEPGPAQTPERNRDEERSSAGLFDLVAESERARPIDGLVVGTVAGLAADGRPLVDFPENPSPDAVPARGVLEIRDDHVGREVALMFENGSARAPVVIGLMHQSPAPAPLEARVDRDRLIFEAGQEIELRCGNASILLTRDGKVRIIGRDILTRASGGNRIKGGSVRIN